MSIENSMLDDGKMLQDALGVVKMQTVQMKRSLDVDQIMEALKSASTMLAELRTSSLSPKQYYELYMSVFDALRFLTNYLYEAHTTGKHHLADLYELVQYAGNIVPRLYLMITVGSVYMSIPDAPIKEIMKDMLEMSRGVQHPTRGLFLRHYLSGQTRDYLPIGISQGADGNLQDSIAFVLTNFVEMNKLWVRLQHQGHSRERDRREAERKELRILVGTNLVRLSQLEGVDLQMYQQAILPSIMEQVVGCRDVIAQEYLMEVVIQVFTDEFHLHTLDVFLKATAQLQPRVDVKQIVIALVDRLAAYAARESENENPDSRRRKEEAAAQRLLSRVRVARLSRTRATEAPTTSTVNTDRSIGESDQSRHPEGARGKESVDRVATVADHEGPGQAAPSDENGDSTPAVDNFRGIPAHVKLFEIFWSQVVDLVEARADLPPQDVTALLVSLVNLAISCYPDRLEYVEQVLMFAADKITKMSTNPDLLAAETTRNVLALLIAPVSAYESALTLLAMPSFSRLLETQPLATRMSIGQAIIASILRHHTFIEDVEDAAGILDLCSILVTPSAGPTSVDGPNSRRANPESGDLAEEQGWLARVIHLLRSPDPNIQFELLRIARDRLLPGGQRIRYTFPSLVAVSLNLTRQMASQSGGSPTSLPSVFKFVHQTISQLYTTVESSDVSLRLFLLAAQFAGDSGLEEVAYEFFVQAFVIYEESISDSQSQAEAIQAIIAVLQQSTAFGKDNYDTLITKAALHGSKLLKKPQQAMAVLRASHMWWQGDVPGRTSDVELFRDGKRVLECLQKALRIASSCIDEAQSVRLYIHALDRYVYYFEQEVEEVSAKYVKSLTELITSNIDLVMPSQAGASPVVSRGSLQQDRSVDAREITTHFRNTLLYVQRRQEEAKSHDSVSLDWRSIDIEEPLAKLGVVCRAS